MKKTIATIAISIALCFAQDAPEKLAVYVSGGASEGINKSFSSKMLAVMSQSGEYAEVADPGAFQDELAKGGKGDMAQISLAAKRHGADYVCVVNMIEAFGAYSITARLIKIAGSQVVKTGSADRALKSLEDLTAASNELARQILPTSAIAPSVAVVPPAAAAVPPIAFAAPPQDAAPPPPPPVEEVPGMAAQKQCARTYNINELLFNLKDGFPNQLKDCASKLAKDMITPASFGGRKLEPVSFMKQCPVDGIKKSIPDGFPGANQFIGSLENFVQGILNSALAGAALDPKKLVSAVGSMNIEGLLSDVKKLAAGECVVDEPYTPPAAPVAEESAPEDKEEKSILSFGIRAGFNFSHTYAEHTFNGRSGAYKDIIGPQVGFVLDIAASDWFHFQPGLMYVHKGMSDDYSRDAVAHYLEIPVLLSLKFSALRLNAGPYFGICIASTSIFGNDIGISTGLGFDIGMFYIGTFYDYGLKEMSGWYYVYQNRTLGFNLGVNL
jgi:hypothetical protein